MTRWVLELVEVLDEVACLVVVKHAVDESLDEAVVVVCVQSWQGLIGLDGVVECVGEEWDRAHIIVVSYFGFFVELYIVISRKLILIMSDVGCQV